jgi:hypothetical protein
VTLTSKPKPPVLLVAPHGMALRNFLLNDRIRGYLTENFDVDVVTPVDIGSPSDWGIRKIIHPRHGGRLSRRTRWLNVRILQRLQAMDFASFCLAGPDPEILTLKLYRDAIAGDSGKTLRWAALRDSRLGSLFQRLAWMLNRVATGSIFKRDDYRLVLLGHSFTPDVFGFGIEANRRGIPVICTTLGHDNLLNPLSFTPNLLLVWGPADKQIFESSHRYRDRRLRNTECVAIGSLADDLYRTTGETWTWDLAGPILVPAMDPIAEPDQIKVCERLVEILDRGDTPNPVIVRTRPGLMQKEWKSFADSHPGRVTLQSPYTAAYDKRFANSVFDKETTIREVAEYAETLRSAALVVTPGLTTVGIEAMSFGVPVISAAFDRSDAVMGRNSSSMLHHGWSSRNAEWHGYRMATSPTELESMINQVLKDRDPAPYLGSEFVEYQMAAADGQAGDRWVAAAEVLISQLADSGVANPKFDAAELSRD